MISAETPASSAVTFDWQAARDTSIRRMCTASLFNDVEETESALRAVTENPLVLVFVFPPIQMSSPRRLTWTWPARPSAVPWLAT